ncbi:HTH domain-containing protein [Tenuifilum thalassicum]|nr:helix-turn-helix domain-containing protein [Tenuifilum thalassicum]
MNIIEIKNELERIDRLIRLKATGSPKELADKLGVSERHVYRIINQLKEIDCPIYFDKDRCSYCYRDEGKLIFKYSTNELDNSIKDKTKGGQMKNNFNIISTDGICQWEGISL